MTPGEIGEIEKELIFKVFLRRIGLHSYTEYLQLFGNDLEKRETAVERYLDTYQKKKGK